LQLAWQMYVHDHDDFIPGNNWWQEAGSNGMARCSLNWMTGWEDATADDNSDNTNTDLFLNPQWASLGDYTKSAAIYHCPASRVMVKEGNESFPLARTVAMNGWMGYTNRPLDTEYKFLHKTTDLVKISPSDAFVFMDERDDSVDDGFFMVGMGGSTMIEIPANYHGGGTAPVTFADGHVELHRWLSADIKFPQQTVATDKYNFISVADDDPDLLWLQAHATTPE